MSAFTLNITNLMKVAVELLKIAEKDTSLCGRIHRLSAQALFALGRSGADLIVEPALNKQWLSACGDDLERDGLSQIGLREKIVEFKMTKTTYFGSIFSGNSSLNLHKAASEFFRSIKTKNRESERVVAYSIGFALLLIAEDRYDPSSCSLQECLERKSAITFVTRTEDDRINFLALTGVFAETRNRIVEENSTDEFSQVIGIGQTDRKQLNAN